ncbi:tannase/feruloyl esterase family alpha/beta hydrolase [Paraburkholderia aromaticivorans]|uniref:tannase/feruloyl esterase family alpha/beta hydrolase n=1 Tax=Paraburkholderia aromaticivorans TaxID=2026199 RepID=UPI00197CDA93
MAAHPGKWRCRLRLLPPRSGAGKALVQAYYTAAPTAPRPCFQGCSKGGQQVMAIAQRYPKDYNGILAGAAANNRTHLNAMLLWKLKALNAPGAKLTN